MKRYTYSMLLNHPWLKPLAQAATVIEEEDESDSDSNSDDGDKGDEAASAVNKLNLNDSGVAGDAEVAAWVTKVLEQKKNDSNAVANAASTKPALHAAPLAP